MIGLIILGFANAFILIPGIVDFLELIKSNMRISTYSVNDIACGNYD